MAANAQLKPFLKGSLAWYTKQQAYLLIWAANPCQTDQEQRRWHRDAYLVPIALEQRCSVGVGVRSDFECPPVQGCAEAAGQVEDGLQLCQQVLYLAQLLNLFPPQLQLGVDRLTALRYTLCTGPQDCKYQSPLQLYADDTGLRILMLIPIMILILILRSILGRIDECP
jgi:hypothetical protein